MPDRRRSLADHMIYEEAASVRRTGEPDLYNTDQELMEFAEGKALLNFLKKYDRHD